MLPTIMVAIFLCLLVILLLKIFKPSPDDHQRRRLPPGPPSIPIIGNLHLLGNLPHRALRDLAQKYGPIMSLRLGSVPTVVISSPAWAEQVLRVHDRTFASRPTLRVAEYVSYGAKGMSLTKYGPYWKFVRRVCTQSLLSTPRIASFAPLRRREVRTAVERLRATTVKNIEKVDLSELVKNLVEEMSFKMIVGSHVNTVGFKALSKQGVRLIGTFNLADYLPFIGPLDIQGLTRQMVKLSKEIDETLHNIIKEVQQKIKDKKKFRNDNEPVSFVEVLLSLMDNPMSNDINPSESQDTDYKIELPNVKAVLGDMIAASYETSVTAIEWTLSELLRHPHVMARVQQELEEIVGLERMVEELDFPKLTYLDMVIMESLRLHPVSPFLVPHESIEDVEINGYFIPKNTRVLVNNFALGRYHDVWPDSEEFVPERFTNSELGFKGNDFRYIPFGSGRRGCPGTVLGLTTIRSVVSQLVHCFEWELPNGMVHSELEMTERFGLALPRANHLFAVPKYRLNC